MHLLNSAREGLICVPVVHEVAAAIATEYHNATVNSGAAATGTGKAFALVTAGPGLTNTLTGIAGAWLESRELLLIGGQVKVEDLAEPSLRQLGIQEVDGVALTRPICKRSICLRKPPVTFRKVVTPWLPFRRPGLRVAPGADRALLLAC
jgi:acetolactate synthase I/II/III large subunit